MDGERCAYDQCQEECSHADLHAEIRRLRALARRTEYEGYRRGMERAAKVIAEYAPVNETYGESAMRRGLAAALRREIEGEK